MDEWFLKQSEKTSFFNSIFGVVVAFSIRPIHQQVVEELFTALWSVKRQRIRFNFREKFELPGILNESAKRRENEGLWRHGAHVFSGIVLSLSRKLLSCTDRAFLYASFNAVKQVKLTSFVNAHKLSLQVLFFPTSFSEIQVWKCTSKFCVSVTAQHFNTNTLKHRWITIGLLHVFCLCYALSS